MVPPFSAFSGVRWPTRRFNTEPFCVLSIQLLPAGEFQSVWAHDATNGLTRELWIQYIQANVPACRAHGDETSVNTGPERQACASVRGFQFPTHIVAAPV